VRSSAVALAFAVTLISCSERFCTDPGVCWANRGDIVAAAARCGVKNFDPPELENGWAPWVQGEDPDKGTKTRCIVNKLKSQGLLVTH
jgi:hypothetical protein